MRNGSPANRRSGLPGHQGADEGVAVGLKSAGGDSEDLVAEFDPQAIAD
jgi:hypothetical protein